MFFDSLKKNFGRSRACEEQPVVLADPADLLVQIAQVRNWLSPYQIEIQHLKPCFAKLRGERILGPDDQYARHHITDSDEATAFARVSSRSSRAPFAMSFSARRTPNCSAPSAEPSS